MSEMMALTRTTLVIGMAALIRVFGLPTLGYAQEINYKTLCEDATGQSWEEVVEDVCSPGGASGLPQKECKELLTCYGECMCEDGYPFEMCQGMCFSG